MNKKIWLVPIHMLSGTGGAGIFDRFIKLRIIETLKELGVTSSNSVVYSNNFRSIYHRDKDGNGHVTWFCRTMNEHGFMVHDVHFSKMEGAAQEWVERKTPKYHTEEALLFSLGKNLPSLVLAAEGIRMYFDDKNMIPNIIIPVEYNFIEIMSTWDTATTSLRPGIQNLTQMGWVAGIEMDKLSERNNSDLSYTVNNPFIDSFLKLFAGLHFTITASRNLPEGKMELLSWLTTGYSNGSDMDWYRGLVWELIHIPNTPEHYNERKDIWTKLHAKKGYVHGSVFPEPAPIEEVV